MRKILFKGKRIDNGEWVEGYYLHLNIGKDYICDGTVWIGTHQPCKYDVDPETVGQYTGLTDKNGKKIFEGDIIKDTYKCKIAPVEAEILNCGCCHSVIGFSTDTTEVDILYCEVIGNRWDNPELLKDGE